MARSSTSFVLCAALAAAPAAWAQEPAPSPTPLPAPPSGAAAAGSVIPYPASFFAAQRPDTAYDMILRLPGFTFDDGSAVRGLAGAAGNVLIDGQRPSSKTDDLQSILIRIPAGQVARIDLIRGGQTGIDMQGKTVVANVIRKSGQGLTGRFSTGQFTTGDGYTDPQAALEETWRGGDRRVDASLSTTKGHDGSNGNGGRLILGPDGQVLDASNTRNAAPNWQYLANGAFESPLAGGRIRLNLTLEDQPYRLDSSDDFAVAGRQRERMRLDLADGEFGLHFTRDLPAGLSLEAFGLQHLNKTGNDSVFVTAADDQHFSLASSGGESVGRGVLHWRRSPTLTIDAGGEYAFNWVRTRTGFIDNGQAVTIPAANVRVQEGRAEGFATSTWRALPTLTVEAGVRVETSTISSTGDVTLSKTLTFPKPRLVLTWSPTAADQVRVRIEREVGQLDFSSFAASAALNGIGITAGNPNLTPQQDWAYEATYERHFGKDGVVSLTARRLDLTDVIDRAPVVSPSGVFDTPANIGDGTESDFVAAFSLQLQRIGLTGATLRGQGTWRDSSVIDPTTGAARRISGQHTADAELHFTQDLPRHNMVVGVDWVNPYHERFFRFDEIDTNHQNVSLDVFVDYKPRPDITWRVQLFNEDHYVVERDIFGGLRSRDPLTSRDLQLRHFGPILFTRLRKTFG
ncbi:TonB-dependent receptor plug domain-containing protein [Phenylobacterium sp.]|jgi:outer membrane receptor protein involved in Fe transport|uniref:TonB-dependent receptor plug domain-containing protein n=1 Tax=Phenylobacterium sp. TaxID=1871053 RepID=UPI002F40DC94